MYFYRILVTGFVLVFLSSSIFAARTTTVKPTTPIKTTKSTTSKTTTSKDGISLKLDQSASNATRKAPNTGKIITTRFGASGNVEEQCQCTLFYLCEDSSVVQGSGTECSDSSHVCCKIPSVVDPLPINSDPGVPEPFPTPSQQSPIDPSQQSCNCIPFYQCTDYDVLTQTAGAGTINFKFGEQCVAPNICCPPGKETPGGGGGNPPQIPEVTPQPSCICVSSKQCKDYDPLTQTAGAGQIDFKFPCNKPDVCCPAEKIIPEGVVDPPKPPTNTPPPSCVCVSSKQCKNYDPLAQTAGAGQLDFKFPCNAPDVCCPPEKIIPGGGVDPPKPPINPEPIPTPKPEECGCRKPSIENKISAPEHLAQTSFGEFPWMALILATEIAPDGTKNENVFVCGASLISPLIVLTAAHCIANYNPDSLRVRVGEYNTREGLTEPLIHQDRAVSRVVIHQNYNNRTAFNDLALIKVTEDFILASHISPICSGITNSIYADPNSYVHSNCLATGWGKNAFNVGEYQTTLKRVDLTIIPRDECQLRLRKTKLGPYFNLHESFICAGGQPGFDTCQGDGGGPLVCATPNNPDQYIQVGVVSWGIGCATDIPGVYASLEANRDWLIAEYNTLTLFTRLQT